MYYRGTEIHNPKYSGGASVDGYEKRDIDRDIDTIGDSKDEKRCASLFVFHPTGTGLKLIFTVIMSLTGLGPLKLEVISKNFPLRKNNMSLDEFVKKKATGNVEFVPYQIFSVYANPFFFVERPSVV